MERACRIELSRFQLKIHVDYALSYTRTPDMINDFALMEFHFLFSSFRCLHWNSFQYRRRHHVRNAPCLPKNDAEAVKLLNVCAITVRSFKLKLE